jgi:hypothetical protein
MLFHIGVVDTVVFFGSGIIDGSVIRMRWLAWTVSWAGRNHLRGKGAPVLNISELCCADPNKHVRLESSIR